LTFLGFSKVKFCQQRIRQADLEKKEQNNYSFFNEMEKMKELKRNERLAMSKKTYISTKESNKRTQKVHSM